MTPDPEAKRRALQQILVSGVGGAPMMLSDPTEDLTPLAPPMKGEQEGVATTYPEPDDPIRQELARLRAQADDRARMADLGAVSSRTIEGLTGARGADIWSGMRERADDPLKDFLRLQEMKSKGTPKPGKPQPTADDIKRLQDFARARWPGEPEAVINAINPERFESIRKTLDAKYGIESREGLAEKQIGATDERARLDREQRGQIWAEQRNLKWADMSLDERKLAESIAAREQATEDKKTARIEDQSKEFGVKYAEGGFPEFKDQYAKAEAIFKKYPKSLPGVGIAEGRVPRRFTSEDGKMLRSVFGQMMLSYKKSVTGLGSSAKEDEAIRDATGLVQTGDDESMRMGVSILKDVMDAKENALQAGYKQEAVDAVISRISGTKPSAAPRVPVSKGLPTGPDGQPTLDEGSVRMTNPKGKVFKVPAGEVVGAEARGWKRVQ